MTTLAQLDKNASKWFCDQMRRRGFAVEKKFIFWRKRGPLYDMFLPELLTGGESLRIRMSIWSPWVESLDGNLGEFPPQYGLIGGTLSEDFPKKMSSGDLFPVETIELMDESFKSILNLIDTCALPWFVTVNSYDSYMSYIGKRALNPTKEMVERIKAGIAKGFECEPYL